MEEYEVSRCLGYHLTREEFLQEAIHGDDAKMLRIKLSPHQIDAEKHERNKKLVCHVPKATPRGGQKGFWSY